MDDAKKCLSCGKPIEERLLDAGIVFCSECLDLEFERDSADDSEG